MKGHQMLAKLRKDQENEEGFTLIELLVVVIIIGILAAIAIPAFLNQRERAYQGALVSDTRNVALDMEAFGTAGNGVYPEADLTKEPLVSYRARVSEPTLTTLEYYRESLTKAMCVVGVRSDIAAGKNLAVYSTVLGGMQDFKLTAAAPTDADKKAACGTGTWGTAVTLIEAA